MVVGEEVMGTIREEFPYLTDGRGGAGGSREGGGGVGRGLDRKEGVGESACSRAEAGDRESMKGGRGI